MYGGRTRKEVPPEGGRGIPSRKICLCAILDLPVDVTTSLSCTMLSCFSALRSFSSRRAVMGKPFTSSSVLILFRATISPVTLSAPTNTLLFCNKGWRRCHMIQFMRRGINMGGAKGVSKNSRQYENARTSTPSIPPFQQERCRGDANVSCQVSLLGQSTKAGENLTRTSPPRPDASS